MVRGKAVNQGSIPNRGSLQTDFSAEELTPFEDVSVYIINMHKER